jgi:hypothetical protein
MVHTLVAHGHGQRVITASILERVPPYRDWLEALPRARRRAHIAYVVHQLAGRCHPLLFSQLLSRGCIEQCAPDDPPLWQLMRVMLLGASQDARPKESLWVALRAAALASMRAVCDELRVTDLRLLERATQRVPLILLEPYAIPVGDDFDAQSDDEVLRALDGWVRFLSGAELGIDRTARASFAEALAPPLFAVWSARQVSHAFDANDAALLVAARDGFRALALAEHAGILDEFLSPVATPAHRSARVQELASLAPPDAACARWVRGPGRAHFASLPELTSAPSP